MSGSYFAARTRISNAGCCGLTSRRATPNSPASTRSAMDTGDRVRHQRFGSGMMGRSGRRMKAHRAARNESRRKAQHATGPTTVTLEVNLRVPDINVKTPDAPVRRITNSNARFLKVITVSALPKVGDDLKLS